MLIEEERQRVLPPPGDDLAQYVACAGGRREGIVMERTPANAEYSFGISFTDQVGPLAAYGIYHGKVRMIIVGYPGEFEELIVRIWHGPPDPWNPDGWAVLGGSVDGIEVRRRQIAIELCSRYDAHRASAIEWVKVEDV